MCIRDSLYSVPIEQIQIGAIFVLVAFAALPHPVHYVGNYAMMKFHGPLGDDRFFIGFQGQVIKDAFPLEN